MLEVRHLSTDQISSVDFHIEFGTCVTLFGPSGAGKTRLLRAIADLDPHGGEVRLDGVPAQQFSATAWRRQVQLMPSEPKWWYPHVGDHFPEFDQAAAAALGFDPAVATWPIERLSSGERQRLGLLRSLAVGPRVLLLDEPTANLDGKNVQAVEALLGNYRRDHASALLWVSHDPAQRRRVSDRQLCLDNGQLAEVAP
ncbi:MAG: ATP-binding cassette domain-containing protein [Pseudomonadota bacterium]|nr:ATP-binding cassette domain-containing protein [Pseudomonadota bacterium]